MDFQNDVTDFLKLIERYSMSIFRNRYVLVEFIDITLILKGGINISCMKFDKFEHYLK